MIRVTAGFAFVALIIFAAAVGGQAREREALTAAPVSPQARFADWHARHSLVSGCDYPLHDEAINYVAEFVEGLRDHVDDVGALTLYMTAIVCPSPASYPLADGDEYNDWLGHFTLADDWQCGGCVYSVAEMVEQGTSLREQVASVGNVLAELMMANEQWWD
jgi:hypothetical protein